MSCENFRNEKFRNSKMVDYEFVQGWNILENEFFTYRIGNVQLRTISTSTTYSSLKRLQKAGFVIRTDSFMIEDPFFERWLRMQQ